MSYSSKWLLTEVYWRKPVSWLNKKTQICKLVNVKYNLMKESSGFQTGLCQTVYISTYRYCPVHVLSGVPEFMLSQLSLPSALYMVHIWYEWIRLSLECCKILVSNPVNHCCPPGRYLGTQCFSNASGFGVTLAVCTMVLVLLACGPLDSWQMHWSPTPGYRLDNK